jgi:hypothetical protein
MSPDQPKPYQLDHGPAVAEQIQSIEGTAKQSGGLTQFADIMEKAIHMLRTDPKGWGDPEYRAKTVNGVMYHATIRPIAFRYAVYEEVRGVVLLRVRQFAEFA